MNIKAIVYTSNTGYTAEYAKLLSERTSLPVYTLDEAHVSLDKGSEIIYLGWLMASMVKGYSKVIKFFDIKAVCGVCLGTTGSQLAEIKKMNKLPDSLPLFTLQGGFDMAKLKGMNKFMMKIVGKAIKKKIMSQPEQSDDDRKIVDMLDNGGSAVDERHLEGILAFLGN